MSNSIKVDEVRRIGGKLAKMAGRFHVGSLLMALAVPATLAQRYTPPPPPLTVDPCTVKPASAVPDLPIDPKAKPVVCPPLTAPKPVGAGSAAEQFPFPGDTPAANKPAAEAFPFPGDAAHKAVAPATPDGGSGAGKPADQFPYPGETSKSPDAVPEGNTPRYVPDAPEGSSSSSGGSSSSSDPNGAPAPDKAAEEAGDEAPPSKARRRLPKVSALSPDDRVSEDLDVAKFYTDRGNFQAAYLRAKDATKTLPDDPEGHFALAQAAQKLQKKDEAVAEYALYLKLDPVGEKRTAAQRALAQLK